MNAKQKINFELPPFLLSTQDINTIVDSQFLTATVFKASISQDCPDAKIITSINGIRNVACTAYNGVPLEIISILKPDLLTASGVVLNSLYFTSSALYKLNGRLNFLSITRSSNSQAYVVHHICGLDRHGDKHVLQMVKDMVELARLNINLGFREFSMYSKVRAKELPCIHKSETEQFQGWSTQGFKDLKSNTEIVISHKGVSNYNELSWILQYQFDDENPIGRHLESCKELNTAVHAWLSIVDKRERLIPPFSTIFESPNGRSGVLSIYQIPSTGKYVVEFTKIDIKLAQSAEYAVTQATATN